MSDIRPSYDPRTSSAASAIPILGTIDNIGDNTEINTTGNILASSDDANVLLGPPSRIPPNIW